MFASTASTNIARRSLALSSPLADGAISVPTAMAGTLIASAIGGRLLAWNAGGATLAQLMIFLMIAVIALGIAAMANARATVGSLDARLARLVMRGGTVQTVLAIATLGFAIL